MVEESEMTSDGKIRARLDCRDRTLNSRSDPRIWGEKLVFDRAGSADFVAGSDKPTCAKAQ